MSHILDRVIGEARPVGRGLSPDLPVPLLLKAVPSTEAKLLLRSQPYGR